MTSSPHGLYAQGCTRATMVWYRAKQYREVEQIAKPCPSSDCGLQLAHMKLESLVIGDQLRRGEYVPEPCTHRPSSHARAGDWD